MFSGLVIFDLIHTKIHHLNKHTDQRITMVPTYLGLWCTGNLNHVNPNGPPTGVWLLCLGECTTRCFTFCPVNEKHTLLLEQGREFHLLGSASAASSEQSFCCRADFDQHLLRHAGYRPRPPVRLKHVKMPSS